MDKYKKTLFQQCFEEKKKNSELKSIEVDAIKKFIKVEVERFSDAEVYTDDDRDSEEDKVIEFR